EQRGKVMGTISSVDLSSGRLTIKDAEGKLVAIALSDKTVFLRGERPVGRRELRAGTRVVVLFEEDGGRKTAVEVRLGEAGQHAEHEHATQEKHAGHEQAAQPHEMAGHAMPGHQMPGHEMQGHDMQVPGAPTTLFELASRREASGTSWQPETTPHAAFHAM